MKTYRSAVRSQNKACLSNGYKRARSRRTLQSIRLRRRRRIKNVPLDTGSPSTERIKKTLRAYCAGLLGTRGPGALQIMAVRDEAFYFPRKPRPLFNSFTRRYV